MCSYSKLEIPRQKGYVHIYMLHHDDDTATLPALLSPEENDRAQLYKNPKDRAQYIALHTFLRSTLSTYLGMAPPDIPIRYTEHYHKPYISLPGNTETIHFNISRRDGISLLAISDKPVGVDVEKYHSIDNLEVMAMDYFSHKEQSWLFGTGIPTLQLYRFFRLWTLKEAYIKAIGLGVSYPLNSFSVITGKEGALGLELPETDTIHWNLKELSVPEDYVAAVAFAAD